MGELVEISGSDPYLGDWRHSAFIPAPLGRDEPLLAGATHRVVAAVGRALAALDATARRLPNPYLLRAPSLRREAQSTSALEGTYAPLGEVLTADDDAPASAEMTEILNYVGMAQLGFDWMREGRPLTLGLIEDLQGRLMRGTPLERESGRLREGQVVIGRRDVAGAGPWATPVEAARFVPAPPGDQLRAGVTALVNWLGADHAERIDPVVVAGMAHYQFETLHPFRDGNGRIGRYLIVLTKFQRDRDRILHSKSFRRLKHKTQVYIVAGDHYRTRMTHSLEVAQISRTIARGLRLNEDLTEAIALGHDVGHTPFGHAGEAVMAEIIGHFAHNEQSLRMVEILERPLNL